MTIRFLIAKLVATRLSSDENLISLPCKSLCGENNLALISNSKNCLFCIIYNAQNNHFGCYSLVLIVWKQRFTIFAKMNFGNKG